MRYLLLIALMGLFTVYQNCSQSLKPNGGGSGQSEEIIGSSAQYTKVVYDPYLEAVFRPGVELGLPKRLEVDIQAGSLRLIDHSNSSVRDCALDSARLSRLRDLLASADICKPGPLPADTAVCMALGLADIELSQAGSSIQLRPVICHNGTFLCAGADVTFRALLADLRDNAPLGCN